MGRARSTISRTFAATRNYNYRLYFFGQIVSMSGTWMQTIGQAWLVLRLTGSGVALGTVTATRFVSVLFLGPVGGLIADRVDKHRLLIVTQMGQGLLALALGLLTLTGTIELWMVYVLAGALGFINAIDNPTRQTFVSEMVGSDLVANAVSLNSVVMNASRVVGPAVAGALIATVGIAPCFLINAGSYVGVLTALAMMRRGDLQRAEPVARGKGQLREGFRYVWSTPALRTPLLMMAAVGTLAYNFQVTLPLMARFSFDAGASAYGAMTSVMGIGAVAGGLIAASLGGPTSRRFTVAAVAFGVLLLGLSIAPTLAVALGVLPLMGAASISFISMANSTLQLTSAPAMRGRVMALYSVAFLGSTPVGGPIVGATAEAFGPRAAIALGGVATLAAGLIGGRSLARQARALDHEDDTLVLAPEPEAPTTAPVPGGGGA